MYCSFFGFREKPFTITPNPQFIFLSTNHKEAFAHLLYGIDSHAGFIELTGEVGTGKTTVLRTLLNQLDGDTYRTALIFNPALSALELLQNINHEFGLPSHESSCTRLLASLNEFLLRENAEGRTVVLVIDEAQNLAPQVLEQIRLISNLETERDKLIQIVLVGQPELRQMLGQPELRQLSQRISVRYHLCPMEYDDAAEYVLHRLRVAAGEPQDIFTDRALKRIFRYSGGLPRLINVVCDRALLVAYTKGSREITGSMAAAAIADVRREEVGNRFGRGRRVAAAAVAASIALLSLYGIFHGLPDTMKVDSATVAAETSTVRQPRHPTDLVPLRKALASQEKGESFWAAFDILARAWGDTASGTPDASAMANLEEIARQRGFEMADYNGNLGALLRMDYPAILEVTLPEIGEKRYVALTGSEKDRLVLEYVTGGRTVVASGELENIWTGRGWVPWKNLLNIPVISQPGTGGEAVRNLGLLLREAGALQGPLTGVYDDAAISAVKEFQAAKGIDTDGVVGSRTLLLLYRASGRVAVFGLTQKGES